MAPYLSWTRAAYIFFVLAVLAALLKLGGAGLAQQKILASEPPDPATTIEITTPETTTPETTTPETTTTERTPTDLAPAPGAASSVVRAPKPTRPASVKRTVARKKPASVGEPPVFYRPSARAAAPDAAGTGNAPAATGPVCGDLGNFPKSSRAVFPLSNLYFDSYEDSWGAPRPQGGHEGADLMSPFDTPEYAITDGTIVPVSGANGNGWNTLGGYTVMLRADYDVGPIEEGDLFYYAHMNKESALKIGTRVRAGQVVGYAGDTGYGPEVTRGFMPSHLHLGWYDTTGARTALDSGAMNPYPLLEWIKANGGAVAGGSEARYCKAPQTGPPVPSSGGDTWSYPTSPGVRPDLDTGSGDGRPSPIVEESSSSIERAPGSEKGKPDRQRPDRRRPGGNRPATDQPKEDPAHDRPNPAPRPPETTAPVVDLPDPPGAGIQPEIPALRPQKPVAANPNSIGHWVDELIEDVTGAPDDARPNGKPGPEDDKPKKHPKKKNPKKEPPDRPKPKHQQRPAPKDDTVCADSKPRAPHTGEPFCEKTNSVPEDTTLSGPDAGKPPETETDNTVPAPPPTETLAAEKPATDTLPTELTEPESNSEPTSGEGTTAQ